MASAFDLGTPEALAPGAKTAGVVGNTQDKLAAFRSHASDDVVRKIREATKLLEQRQAAAKDPPAEEDHPSYMEGAAKTAPVLPEAHAAPAEAAAPEPAAPDAACPPRAEPEPLSTLAAANIVCPPPKDDGEAV